MTANPPKTIPGRKTLPFNEDAEYSVVGGLILHPKKISVVAPLVSAEDFYHPILRVMFEAICALAAESKPVDELSIHEKMSTLGTVGRLRAVNGAAFFAEATSRVVTVENIDYHAKMVRGKATARRTIEAAHEILLDGAGEYGEAAEFVARSQARFSEIARGASTGKGVLSVRVLLNDALRELESRFEHRGQLAGLTSGFRGLDYRTGGAQLGDLIVIAGRPSMGKTALADGMMLAAARQGIPGLKFSLEMSALSLILRWLATEARVDGMKLKTGYLDTRDWINLTKAATFLAEAPLWIDDSPTSTIAEVSAKTIEWRGDVERGGKHKIAQVQLDYLQLLGGKINRNSNREQEVAGNSRGCKMLATETKVVFVLLSQLNRNVESRQDKRPMMSDLRESGAVENDADTIHLVYRDEYYNKDSPDRGVAEVITCKQRNGDTGTTRLAFLNQYTRFENLAEVEDEAEYAPPPPPVPASSRWTGPRRPSPGESQD